MDEPSATEPSRPTAFQRVPSAALRNRRFLLALALILIGVSLWIAWPYRAAIVLAVVLGYVLRPLYHWLLKGLRYRWIAASVVLLLVATALIAPMAYIAWSLLDDVSTIRENLVGNGARERLVDVLAGWGLPAQSARDLIGQAFEAGTALLESMLITALTGALELVLGLVVFFILLFYTLTDGERMVKMVHDFAPLSGWRRRRLVQQVGERVKAIMLGTFFVYALQGVVGGIGWWIFGFPAPVFWGFVMTILAILPFMGPQLVTLPAGIFALMQGDTFAGVGLIVWTLVAVSLIDDLVRPWVIGRTSGVHPALILVGTLGGISVLGLSGLVLGPLLLGLLEPVLRAWAGTTRGAGHTHREDGSAPPEHRARHRREPRGA